MGTLLTDLPRSPSTGIEWTPGAEKGLLWLSNVLLNQYVIYMGFIVLFSSENELWASHILDKYSTTELHSHLNMNLHIYQYIY